MSPFQEGLYVVDAYYGQLWLRTVLASLLPARLMQLSVLQWSGEVAKGKRGHFSKQLVANPREDTFLRDELLKRSFRLSPGPWLLLYQIVITTLTADTGSLSQHQGSAAVGWVGLGT